MNKVEVLIISSTIDFATDYICLELDNRGSKYLRINRDDFSNYKVEYNFEKEMLVIVISGSEYIITNDALKSVYFRAPVFIRSNKHYSVSEQLSRGQWSSFIRNLVIFNKAVWVNPPVDTYKAENKMLQLVIAKHEGLTIPRTILSNYCSNNVDEYEDYIVKALDTPLFYEGNYELFTHSSVVSGKELKKASLSDAPVFIQECLKNKIDLRVTVVGNQVFPVCILKDGKGIEGDWRKVKKESLEYITTTIPDDIKEKILKLMEEFNLKFGGVDLILADGNYYFIEVNPTGEWAWLVNTTGLPIATAIVNLLEGEE